MSYDPTQQVPPPQGYPPQQGYPQQQGYPSQPQGYPQQPPPPTTYPQYGAPSPYGSPPAGAGFDFNAFWKKLGLTGQICLIGGVVLFISFLIPWYGISDSCSGSGCNGFPGESYSWNAFSVIGNVAPNGNTGGESFGFPLILLVILASLALIALPIIGAMGKMAAKQVQLGILGAGGLALLLEIIFMIAAFNSFPKARDAFKQLQQQIQQAGLNTSISLSIGPNFGFWLGLLATLAIVGAYVYFGYLKKPAMAGMPVGAYSQPGQYPGQYSQPGQYPPQTGYPGSQPYQPPTAYPGSQPGQYPPQQGQYPGQPPYPGQ
jgi:hypothetical protein